VLLDVIASLDVGYRRDEGRAACVLFREWADALPMAELVRELAGVAAYRSGEFFRRELPCLLALLHEVEPVPSVLIVDGYVWLGPGRAGLGARLHVALGEGPAVVGVAKTPFDGAPCEAITRGRSRTPLFVSAAGMPVAEAARRIVSMHGPFRLPTMLRLADRLSRWPR
jgi:deoxyribonuclease V